MTSDLLDSIEVGTRAGSRSGNRTGAHDASPTPLQRSAGRGGATRGWWVRGGRDGEIAAHLRTLQPLISLMPPRDRIIVSLVPTGERSLRETAKLLDLAPGLICRRLKTLWRRLHDPLCLHLLEPPPRCSLPPEHRQIGIERHFLAMHLHEIADKHRIPHKRVRRMLDQLKGYADAKGIRRTP